MANSSVTNTTSGNNMFTNMNTSPGTINTGSFHNQPYLSESSQVTHLRMLYNAFLQAAVPKGQTYTNRVVNEKFFVKAASEAGMQSLFIIPLTLITEIGTIATSETHRSIDRVGSMMGSETRDEFNYEQNILNALLTHFMNGAPTYHYSFNEPERAMLIPRVKSMLSKLKYITSDSDGDLEIGLQLLFQNEQ
jgi:hypothetical protein